MYKFIKTVKQLIVSLHFISEDLTFDAAHKESNSFGTQSVCYPRRLYDHWEPIAKAHWEPLPKDNY